MPTSPEPADRLATASPHAAFDLTSALTRLEPRLERYAKRVADDSWQVSEIVQAGRLGAYNALLAVDPARVDSADAYVWQTAKFAMLRCAGQLRRSRARYLSIDQMLSDGVLHGPMRANAEDPISLALTLAHAEPERDGRIVSVSADFLATLPVELRATAIDLYWDGLSQAESARKRGVSRMTVTKRVVRIRQAGLNFLPFRRLL